VKKTLWVGLMLSFLVSFSSVSEAQPLVARHGMPSPVYQTESAVWKSQGYRLLHVSGYEVGGLPLYAAIWEQTPGPPRIARHGLPAPVLQIELNIWKSQGYRLLALDGYSLAGQPLYAAIWEQAPGPQQVIRYGMIAPVYQTEFNIWVSQGYRLKKVEGYAVGNMAYYAAIWEKTSGPAWKARHGLNAAQYLAEHLRNTTEGYRLEHVSGYSVGGMDYYAAIWEEADGPAWVAHHRETSEDFQHELVDRRIQGYRLKQVDGYAIGGSAHYAAIWEAEPDALTGTYCEGGRCFDLRRVADGLEALLAGNVKYGFELRRGRSVIRRAQGPKRTSADPPASSFTAFDRFNPASVSKSVTAVATLQLLSKRGLTIDEPIHRHLPSEWNIPANNETITFAEVLNHTSGLRNVNAGGGEYHHMQQLMEHEIRLADKVYQYQNANYSLLRILVASLDGYTDWARSPGPNSAARFISYVNKKVFSPLGIYDVEYRPEPQGTLFYPNPPGSAHGTSYGDSSLTPGSAGSQVSVHELAVFGAATFDGMLLTDAMLEDLKQHGLGFGDYGRLPDGSQCWGKGGYFPGSWNGGAELNSVLVHCANGVTGMLVINGDPAAWPPLRDALVAAFVPE
jgi:CubicO group peptidase (beta-lactamase class C family)